MSGASFQELFLLMIIGLVILGPKRLPQVANQIGSWLGQARRMTRMMKRQLEDEINFDLSSINIQNQLGLDQSTEKVTDSVAQPRYVNETANTAEAGPQSAAAAEPSPPVEELPDDYSPAHAADEVGTGVGDDAVSPDGDRSETVSTAHPESSAEPADDKKETA